eukprot:gene7622-11945_t
MEEEDEKNECLICLNNWKSTGEHRVVSLKCGHIFGKSCIEFWLQSNCSCPICKEKADILDIRNLYLGTSTYKTSIKRIKQRSKTAIETIEKKLKLERKKKKEIDMKYKNIKEKLVEMTNKSLNITNETLKSFIEDNFKTENFFKLVQAMDVDFVGNYICFLNDPLEVAIAHSQKPLIVKLDVSNDVQEQLLLNSGNLKIVEMKFNFSKNLLLCITEENILYFITPTLKIVKKMTIEHSVNSLSINEFNDDIVSIGTVDGYILPVNINKFKYLEKIKLNDRARVSSIKYLDKQRILISQGKCGCFIIDDNKKLKKLNFGISEGEDFFKVDFEKHSKNCLVSTGNIDQNFRKSVEHILFKSDKIDSFTRISQNAFISEDNERPTLLQSLGIDYRSMKSPYTFFSTESDENNDDDIISVQPMSSKTYLVYSEKNKVQFKNVENQQIEMMENFHTSIQDIQHLKHSLGLYIGILTKDEFCLYLLEMVE